MARTPTCHPERPHKAHGLCGACYPLKNPVKAKCHPDRPHHAKGLCHSCYQMSLWEYTPRQGPRVPDCGHPTRPHIAFGLCAQCYNKQKGAKRKAEGYWRNYYKADPTRRQKAYTRGWLSAHFGRELLDELRQGDAQWLEAAKALATVARRTHGKGRPQLHQEQDRVRSRNAGS